MSVGGSGGEPVLMMMTWASSTGGASNLFSHKVTKKMFCRLFPSLSRSLAVGIKEEENFYALAEIRF